MLEMAQVKSGDVIYDLGSGDGRIIIRAAKRYGVKGVGIEIDADLVQKANDNAFKEKVDHLVEFRAQDASHRQCFCGDGCNPLHAAGFNAKLRPIFDKQLKPGPESFHMILKFRDGCRIRLND